MKAKNTEEEEDSGGPASQETRRLMDLLQMFARALGFSNAALARRAKVSLASLMRYFRGEAEPRLEFVIAVVWALGLTLREFIEFVYPYPDEPSPSRKKIERLLGPILPGRTLESAPKAPEPQREVTPLHREDVERMLEDLRRDVREILEKQAGRTAAPEAKPRKKNGE